MIGMEKVISHVDIIDSFSLFYLPTLIHHPYLEMMMMKIDREMKLKRQRKEN